MRGSEGFGVDPNIPGITEMGGGQSRDGWWCPRCVAMFWGRDGGHGVPRWVVVVFRDVRWCPRWVVVSEMGGGVRDGRWQSTGSVVSEWSRNRCGVLTDFAGGGSEVRQGGSEVRRGPWLANGSGMGAGCSPILPGQTGGATGWFGVRRGPWLENGCNGVVRRWTGSVVSEWGQNGAACLPIGCWRCDRIDWRCDGVIWRCNGVRGQGMEPEQVPGAHLSAMGSVVSK